LIEDGKRKNECEFALGLLTALKGNADKPLRRHTVRTYGTAAAQPGRAVPAAPRPGHFAATDSQPGNCPNHHNYQVVGQTTRWIFLPAKHSLVGGWRRQ